MTHNNITSGFRATGLYPFNSQVLPETAFAPSIVTEVPAPDVEEDEPPIDYPRPQSLETNNVSPSILAEATVSNKARECTTSRLS